MGCCDSKPDVSTPVQAQISKESIEIESINGKAVARYNSKQTKSIL